MERPGAACASEQRLGLGYPGRASRRARSRAGAPPTGRSYPPAATSRYSAQRSAHRQDSAARGCGGGPAQRERALGRAPVAGRICRPQPRATDRGARGAARSAAGKRLELTECCRGGGIGGTSGARARAACWGRSGGCSQILQRWIGPRGRKRPCARSMRASTPHRSRPSSSASAMCWCSASEQQGRQRPPARARVRRPCDPRPARTPG